MTPEEWFEGWLRLRAADAMEPWEAEADAAAQVAWDATAALPRRRGEPWRGAATAAARYAWERSVEAGAGF